MTDHTADSPFAQSIERADDVTAKARSAIKAIPLTQFGEREVAALIETLQAHVSASNWSHLEHAEALSEALTDAHVAVEDAADAMALEAA